MHSNIFDILPDTRLWLIMINVMLYWFHNHSSLTFSFTHTRLIRILRVKMDSWILNTYLPRCILIYRTYALPGRLAMRNIMPNGFHNYSSSSFSSTIAARRTRLVRILRANMKEQNLNTQLLLCILLYWISFPKCTLVWRWELLCWFDFIIIPHRRSRLQ